MQYLRDAGLALGKQGFTRLRGVPALLVAVVLTAGSTLRAEEAHKYAAFDVTSHDDPKVAFHFSAADATSSDPVVISISGRKLTNEDRVHRVSLQKHWLSVNVPSTLKPVSRCLAKCGLKREGEFAACDRYTFVDPATQKQFEYYIYVGNWP
jgi:hypothetical protein